MGFDFHSGNIMFSTISKKKSPILLLSFAFMMLFGLSACDSAPPKLMKASKQFDSDETRDKHVAYMRKNHMDVLMHKRDETMYEGIRTKKGSLKACINCHVPEEHNGEILRHTNPEHFCSTCHGYVATQLDCFQCHVDHPVDQNKSASSAINPHNQNAQQLQHPGLPVTDNTQDEKMNDLSLAQNKATETIDHVVSGGAASE